MKRGVVLLLALLLAACNMSVPQVTPTVRPTLTPSETPFRTATAPPTLTATRTQTPTLTLTDTPPPTATESPTSPPSETFTASFTPSQTPTGTPPPTDTPTFTLTPSDTATPTLTPTDTNTPTPTPTDTATDTPAPSATRTRTPSATFTPLPTATPPPSNTFTPSPTNTATTPPTPTPLPTLGATATFSPTVTPPPPTDTPLPSRTFTPTLSATPLPPSLTPTGEGGIVPLGERPELTLVPVTPPTTTPGIPPTLDTTPTLVTAAPGTQVTIQVTPLEALTSTPLPTPPTLEVINPTPLPTLITADPSTFSFALSTSNGVLNSSAFSLPGSTTSFARNPVDPNRYATVDTSGLLYLVSDIAGGGRARMTFSPFSDNVPPSARENNANVTQVAWSPDGRLLAFLVDTDSDDFHDNDLQNDGVWYLEPRRETETDPTYQLLRDCPPEPSCSIVDAGDGPFRWRSLRFEWNAQSSGILVTVQLPDENRQGFIVVDAVPDTNYAQTRQPVYRYDFASWAQDGSGIIASGANGAGQVGVWRINRASGQEEMLFDGSSRGLWVQSAVERPGGQVVMLGSFGGAGGAMALYDTNGTALTGTIGSAAPARVDWSPDHSAVLLVVPEGGVPRYYVAQVNGQAREITQAVAGALAVEWVRGQPPPSANPAAAVPPAAPTPTETTFAIGQTVSVVATEINLRPAPGINNEPVGVVNFGAVLTIQEEPVSADGYRWYLVTTDDGRAGYVADAVNGISSISP